MADNPVTVPSKGRSQIDKILERHPPHRDSLIPILQDVQDQFGYLSPEAVTKVAQCIGISDNEVYGVATFYTQFRFSPPGEHRLQVCQGTACHVRGATNLQAELQRHLGVSAGQTTADGKFDLERVACLGCCALSPVVAVDGKVHARVTARKIPALLAQYRDKEDDETR